MKINFTMPVIGDIQDYVGLPILDKIGTYILDNQILQKGINKPIGVITNAFESDKNNVLVEAEIWDKFVTIEYSKNVMVNGMEKLNSVSILTK